MTQLEELTGRYTPLKDHSPLGASASNRFIRCPGSVMVAQGCVDDDDEFSAPGSAAHKVAELCLREGLAPWNYVGRWYEKDTDEVVLPAPEEMTDDFILIDKEITDAVDIYVSNLRARHQLKERPKSNAHVVGGADHHAYVEKEFHCPSIHPLFWGMSDWVFVDLPEHTLHIEDYKHGAGIVVEANNNPQGMYYAVGILESMDLWDRVDTVVIHICQPRGFHWEGPHRSWSISTADLEDWLEDELLPAMELTLNQNPEAPDVDTGENCRFCPAAGYQCPGIIADLERMDMFVNQLGGAAELDNGQLGEFLKLFEVAKIAAKRHRDVAFHRVMAGKKVPGQKLVNARSNREWKKEGEAALKKAFGAKAYEPRKLKSPAMVEKMPKGEALAIQHSSKPDKGLTLVPATDSRREVSRDTKSLFTPQKKGKK